MGDSSAPGVALKDLSPAQFSRLSELLDESIELPPGTRDAWLLRIEREDPTCAALLRALLASQEGARAREFLETRDFLARHVAPLIEEGAAPIGKQFGPYRALALLGRGGMGSVWLAERADGLFARRVALKLVHPALMGQVMTERFTRERRILASLDHPNIARLIDAGFAEDAQPYLALEYVAGVPITTYCDERSLSIRGRLELFRQVLAAVQYAHAHLVIHRDLKPSNIMVTEEGQVRLLDFGIAKLLVEGEAPQTELTRLGGNALTPEYAAPEQIAGAPITTAADVYSLGVILYELLTGERPYKLKRESRGALEEAILQAEPVAPSRAVFREAAAGARSTTVTKLAKMLRGDLDTITMKALKKPPAERYATPNAFAEDIARHLGGNVVLAQRDRFAYRALKFARRNRLWIAAASLLLLTLAGGLAASLYEAEVASAQRDAALKSQRRALTQAAAARLANAEVPAAAAIILEVLGNPAVTAPYPADALNVFQEARAADRQVLAITGHTDGIRRAAFSPDGRRIVTASRDGTARVWDAASGEELLTLRGHTAFVTSALFSPDGRRILTGSSDRTARIWDAASGEALLILEGHTDMLTSASFSSDGRRVLTASRDKSVRVWDAASGRPLLPALEVPQWALSAAFSPDGTRIVIASQDKTARIFDAASGRELMRLSGHTDRFESVAFSPDGRRIVAACFDKTARIFDAASGRQILALIGHTDGLLSAQFSPDGQSILTTSFDGTARVWDAESGQQLLLLSGHTQFVQGGAFSPDGQRIVTASFDGTARVWDVPSAQQRLILRGHPAHLVASQFSPDGRRIVTASWDRTARVWDATSGAPLLVLAGHGDTVASATFSPDGGRILTASWDQSARLFDAKSARQLLVMSGHAGPLQSAAFSPDGQRIVTASDDRTARIWDAASGRPLAVLEHPDRVTMAAFSPDGQRIVTASEDKTARIWDAASARQLVVLRGHTGLVQSAAFSGDGRRILTASVDRTARIWDAASGRPLSILSGHSGIVESAAFSPDGRSVVTAADDKSIRLWDAGSAQQLLVLSGHGDSVQAAAFSPDGRRVVSASLDGTARVWDVRSAALEAQLLWAEAAQFEPLSGTERLQLGLGPAADVRSWPTEASRCDQSAAAPYDPQRQAPGSMLAQIDADAALAACADPAGSSAPQRARALYQRGRARLASRDFAGARSDLESARAAGHHAAGIDLALLLSLPAAGMLDAARAERLYEEAWSKGVPIAAFELGSLYEHGVAPGAPPGRAGWAADPARAWAWYRRGADAGEPYALARFAAAQGRAALDAVARDRTAHLVAAFKGYAAAAERARREDWPEMSWRDWRYRRASLARLLARDGEMAQVVAAYEEARTRSASAATGWSRLTAALPGVRSRRSDAAGASFRDPAVE